MSHSPDEIDALLNTKQEYVFLNDAARDSTVEFMKKCFQFNESGIERVDCLHEHKCDRELVGHLIGLLTQNISNLQESERKLTNEKSDLETRFKLQEQEINNLRHENKIQRDKNASLSTIMTRCGLSSAIRNCEILNTVVQMVKEDGGFEQLEAAVRCFGSEELTQKLDSAMIDQDAVGGCTRNKSESPDIMDTLHLSYSSHSSSSSKRQRRISVEEESVAGSIPPSEGDLDSAFSTSEFTQPYIPQLPVNSVQLYYQLVAQQEIHKQLLFNQTQRTNSTPFQTQNLFNPISS